MVKEKKPGKRPQNKKSIKNYSNKTALLSLNLYFFPSMFTQKNYIG